MKNPPSLELAEPPHDNAGLLAETFDAIIDFLRRVRAWSGVGPSLLIYHFPASFGPALLGVILSRILTCGPDGSFLSVHQFFVYFY